MLKDLVLVGIGAVFGLGAALMSLAAPLYFPNAPTWVWHYLFWGGIALMALMVGDGGILLWGRLRLGPAILANIAILALAASAIWQTYPGTPKAETIYDNPLKTRWPLAPAVIDAVIDYVALSLGISQQEACLAFQQRDKSFLCLSSRRRVFDRPYRQNILGAYLEPRQMDKGRKITSLTFRSRKREAPKFAVNLSCRG